MRSSIVPKASTQSCSLCPWTPTRPISISTDNLQQADQHKRTLVLLLGSRYTPNSKLPGQPPCLKIEGAESCIEAFESGLIQGFLSGAGTTNPHDYVGLTHNNLQIDNASWFKKWRASMTLKRVQQRYLYPTP